MQLIICRFQQVRQYQKQNLYLNILHNTKFQFIVCTNGDTGAEYPVIRCISERIK